MDLLLSALPILVGLFSIPTLAVVIVSVIFGYVLRKYVEKRFASEAKFLDEVAQRYGDRAVLELVHLRDLNRSKTK